MKTEAECSNSDAPGFLKARSAALRGYSAWGMPWSRAVSMRV